MILYSAKLDMLMLYEFDPMVNIPDYEFKIPHRCIYPPGMLIDQEALIEADFVCVGFL